MPMNRRTAASTPHSRNAASITSVSDPPRKAWPFPSSSARISRKLYTSPLKERTSDPSAENIGCAPAGERSRIDSRRWESPTRPSGERIRPGGVRPAVRHRIPHRAQHSLARPGGPGGKEAGDPAHGYRPPRASDS